MGSRAGGGRLLHILPGVSLVVGSIIRCTPARVAGMGCRGL